MRGTKPTSDEDIERIMRHDPTFKKQDFVCHLFIREGMIQYLTDSTHHLAGQTIPMEPF